jgi:hypothetical protein
MKFTIPYDICSNVQRQSSTSFMQQHKNAEAAFVIKTIDLINNAKIINLAFYVNSSLSKNAQLIVK